MKNYYLRDGGREKGPFMLDDLKYQRIRKTTEVKIDDGDWHLVSDNSDLRSLLDLKEDNSVGKSTASASGTVPRNNAPQQVNKKLTLVIAIVMLMVSMGVAVAVFLAGGG
jgi:hypothetical protein